MMCKKYVQTHSWKKHLCALQVFLCALASWPVCARTRAQLRGNIGRGHYHVQQPNQVIEPNQMSPTLQPLSIFSAGISVYIGRDPHWLHGVQFENEDPVWTPLGHTGRVGQTVQLRTWHHLMFFWIVLIWCKVDGCHLIRLLDTLE